MENEVLNQLKDSELPECDLEKLVEENNLNFELYWYIYKYNITDYG
jgi:hypothetical protein